LLSSIPYLFSSSFFQVSLDYTRLYTVLRSFG
jgi:hypothetical protein